MATQTGTATSRMLLRRGLMLEYATLSWNVVGALILILAAAAVATVVAMFALAAGKFDTGRRLGNPVLQTESRGWWADPLAALIILVYGLREARHAWTEAAF